MPLECNCFPRMSRGSVRRDVLTSGKGKGEMMRWMGVARRGLCTAVDKRDAYSMLGCVGSFLKVTELRCLMFLPGNNVRCGGRRGVSRGASRRCSRRDSHCGRMC